jgi:hypothetical protein
MMLANGTWMLDDDMLAFSFEKNISFTWLPQG